LYRLKEKGKVKPAAGGRTIVQELDYAENGTFLYYSGYDTLNVSPSDVFSAAEFDWKQAFVAVTINGLEQLQNTGKEQVVDLLDARVTNAERTMMNNIAAGMYADGTGSGGKEIGGLQLLVPYTNNSGTVGGINRATSTNAFWRNYSRNSNTASVTASATTVQSEFNTVYSNIVRGTDRPDLIIVDNTWWTYYLGSLQAIQRITSDKMAQAGFMSLKYMDADVVLDGGIGGACPSNTAYFINSDYLFYRPHSARNMVPIGGERMNTNQDAIVKLIGWAGNMTLSNAQLQGVLKVS
jgi:hypothetical protein